MDGSWGRVLFRNSAEEACGGILGRNPWEESLGGILWKNHVERSCGGSLWRNPGDECYAGVLWRKLVEESQFQLVETMAEKISELILTEHGVHWVKVKVNKPGAIRGSKGVGIIIERGKNKSS